MNVSEFFFFVKNNRCQIKTIPGVAGDVSRESNKRWNKPELKKMFCLGKIT